MQSNNNSTILQAGIQQRLDDERMMDNQTTKDTLFSNTSNSAFEPTLMLLLAAGLLNGIHPAG